MGWGRKALIDAAAGGAHAHWAIRTATLCRSARALLRKRDEIRIFIPLLEHRVDIALPETARKMIFDNATTLMDDSKVWEDLAS